VTLQFAIFFANRKHGEDGSGLVGARKIQF
jgi:hypothetical protein